MVYSKTNWVDNTTPIDENNLNKIEQGIYDNSLVIDELNSQLSPSDTETYKTVQITEGQITDVIGISEMRIKGQIEQDGSPTPTSPKDVKVVSGNNFIYTSNKNRLSLSNIPVTATGATMQGQNGVLIVNGTPTQTPTVLTMPLLQDIKLNPNDKITISVNNSEGIGSGANYVALRFLGTVNGVTNGNIVDVRCDSANATGTFTATEPTIIKTIAVRGNSNVTFSNFTLNPQIELTETATSYEIHMGKQFPLNLPSTIELCKIGDHQDYIYKSGSKWYVYNEIVKITLNGSESWTLRETNTNTIRLTADGLSSYYILPQSQVYSTAFKGYSTNTDLSNIDIPSISPRDAGTGFNMRFPTNIATTAEGVRTWLSNNLPSVYYVTSRPTNTEITNSTLIAQLEAIYNAPLYEQTNITQENNDLPMVLDITACKDNINGIKAFIRK